MEFRCEADRWFQSLSNSQKVLFTDTRRELFDDRVTRIVSMQGDAPSTLFHYTDVFGFFGILASGVLHCTNISTMNDPTEVEEARTVAGPLLARKVESYARGSKSHGLLTYANQRLSEIGTIEPIRSFVSCFSPVSDDIGQWLRYGRGRGVAIEFNTKEIINSGLGSGFRLIRCLYKTTEQEAVINELLEFAVQQYLTLSRAAKTGGERRLYTEAVLYAVAPFLAVLKSSEWRFEKEWRTLCYNAPGSENLVDTLIGPKFLRRKVDLDFRKVGLVSAIRSVIIRPGDHPELNRQGAEAGLDAKGIHVPVLISKARLRD